MKSSVLMFNFIATDGMYNVTRSRAVIAVLRLFPRDEHNWASNINPLRKKRRLLYLKTQFVAQ